MKVTPDYIHSCLPDEPDGYHYSVERVSPLVHRVWLNHERDYVFSDEPVQTVWGFIKQGKVYPAKNSKMARAKSVCDLLDAYKLSCYSVINDTHNVTSHLGS